MIAIDRLDHIHVYVKDRAAAEEWYGRVLGLRRKPELESWAVPHGPLMLQTANEAVVLALFQRETGAAGNSSTIALGVSGAAFREWKKHLETVLDSAPRQVDHGLAWSLYFSDPDGNPFEVTTYDYEEIAGA